MKWPAGNQNIHVSQKKSNNHSLCICYLKVIRAQLIFSTLLRTLRVCINSSFFGYFDSLERSTFYFIKIGLIYQMYVMLFQTLGSILLDFPFLSVLSHLKMLTPIKLKLKIESFFFSFWNT